MPPNGAGGPAGPARRISNTRLILLVAALVGILVGGTIGFFIFTNKGTASTPTAKATATPTPQSYLGTVSFTASGGLQGDYTIALPKATPPASSIQKGVSDRLLEIVVNHANMDFELGISPYPGPGTYTLLPFEANPAPGSYHGAVRISNHQSTWSLHPEAECKVTITSDTPTNRTAQDKPVNEVKGTFSCPKLENDTGGDASIKVTQGQFDVYAEVFG